MATDDAQDARNEALRLLENEIAELREQIEQLRAGLAQAEDDPGDAGLIRRAFRECKMSLDLDWV